MMKHVILWCIGFYRKYLSGLKKTPTCPFIPTCSRYAYEAVQTHGALYGSFLALRRILRCNPFTKGGYDPVPPKRTKTK
ncbi:MAG: membrane protein insertion efficiency factor YidD [Clostridia bacterium]|nr:membrane protein insertion efficiency factor YidD [Clostridia bacterium]MBR5265592.1 membrane protein insertion efficiency factor YidD [Clostridia bacterium]